MRSETPRNETSCKNPQAQLIVLVICDDKVGVRIVTDPQQSFSSFLRKVGLLAAALMLSGCGQQLEEWVRNARPLNGIPQKFDGQSSVKISPGTAHSTSHDGSISVRSHITIMDRKLIGGDVSATVSMGQTRTGVTQ